MPKQHPVGLTIVEARPMTSLELDAEGWEESFHGKPVVLVLSDGSKLYASADVDGNRAGALFGVAKDGSQFTLHTSCV